MDPYWKIRFYTYTFNLSVFGNKFDLIKNIEDLLFINHTLKKPSSDPDLFDIDLEILVRNGRYTTGLYEGITYKSLEAKYIKGLVFFQFKL